MESQVLRSSRRITSTDIGYLIIIPPRQGKPYAGRVWSPHDSLYVTSTGSGCLLVVPPSKDEPYTGRVFILMRTRDCFHVSLSRRPALIAPNCSSQPGRALHRQPEENSGLFPCLLVTSTDSDRLLTVPPSQEEPCTGRV